MDAPPETVESLQRDISLLALQAKKRLLEAIAEPRRLKEADQFSANFIDPGEQFLDNPEFLPQPFGGLDHQVPLHWENQNRGELIPFYVTEYQLRLIRDISRRICAYNPYAINALNNRVSYIVGEGYTYTVRRRDDDAEGEDDPLCQAAQDVIDEFKDINDWSEIEQEAVYRADRDGEAILRLFPQPNGQTFVRQIEPEHLRANYGAGEERRFLYGVETAPDDIQNILAYWLVSDPLKGMVADERVDPEEIVHIRLNSTRNAKRGLPTLYPIRHNFERAEKLLRNMSILSQIRATFAAIRTHDGYSVAAVQAFVDAQIDATVNTSLTTNPQQFQYYRPGSVIDAPKGTEYQFPSDGVNAASYVEILQAELRSIAAALVMTENMLTANAADMAAYTAALVAESSVIKNFVRLQKKFMRAFGDGVYCDSSYGRKSGVMWRVLRNAVLAGRIPQDVLRQCEIQAEAPSIVVREKDKEVQRDSILHSSGVLSKRTWASQQGLDYDLEQANLAEEQELLGPPLGDLEMPPEGQPGQPPQRSPQQQQRPPQAA